MTDKPKNKLQFSDDQMDQLLTSFYKSEIPAQLDALPSSWPQIKNKPAAKQASTAGVSLSTVDRSSEVTAAPASRRGIAVAAATLAACLLLFVTSGNNTDPGGVPNGTVEVQPTDGVAGPEFMNVSSEGGTKSTGVVDDNGTTLDETEGVDLSPSGKAPKSDKQETRK